MFETSDLYIVTCTLLVHLLLLYLAYGSSWISRRIVTQNNEHESPRWSGDGPNECRSGAVRCERAESWLGAVRCMLFAFSKSISLLVAFVPLSRTDCMHESAEAHLLVLTHRHCTAGLLLVRTRNYCVLHFLSSAIAQYYVTSSDIISHILKNNRC